MPRTSCAEKSGWEEELTDLDATPGNGIAPTMALRVVMLSGGALAGLALTALNPVLPAIDAALSRSPHDSLLVKQLLGAVAVTMVLGAPIAGFLVDRFSLRRLLLIAAVVYTLAGTTGLYFNTLSVLLGSRLFLGLAAGALQVISLSTINRMLVGTERARWMGYHVSLAMATALIVNPLSGLLGNFDWRWPFALYGIGLIMVPVALLQSDANPARASNADPATSQRPSDRTSLWRVFPYHYLPMAVIIGCMVFIPTVYAPFLLRAMGIKTPFAISLVLTAESIVGLGVAMLYGKARRHISAHGAFAFSFCFVAAGMLFITVTATPVLFIVGMTIYGIGVGWLIANLITSLSEKVGPGQQGRAAGLVKAAHFSSAPIGIALVEPITRAQGPAIAMPITAALALGLLTLIGVRKWIVPGRRT